MFNTPLSVAAGRLPDDVLDYIVQHSMGVALNVEQMARPNPLLFCTSVWAAPALKRRR